MDRNTSIEELKNVVKDFCEEREWGKFHTPKDLAIMVTVEAAELLEIFRYKDEQEIKEIFNGEKRVSIEEEVSDVLFNLLRFAEINNIDISTAFYSKIDKNNKKYPVEKSKGCNKKYNEL